MELGIWPRVTLEMQRPYFPTDLAPLPFFIVYFFHHSHGYGESLIGAKVEWLVKACLPGRGT